MSVPPPYKILGGGAFDDWMEPGNLLTDCCPDGSDKWYVAGKDHQGVSPASITGYVVAIYDQYDEWDVVTVDAEGEVGDYPSAEAFLPLGYILTGGGARVYDNDGYGSLLVASYPYPNNSSWVAKSRDHVVSSPASIRAYAIGIRHRTNNVKLEGTRQFFTGSTEAYPKAQVSLPPGWFLTGGGASDDWQEGDGNFLTASYPLDNTTWYAAGKQHVVACPGAITAWALGIRLA
jgi:hypothetical protein